MIHSQVIYNEYLLHTFIEYIYLLNTFLTIYLKMIPYVLMIFFVFINGLVYQHTALYSFKLSQLPEF